LDALGIGFAYPDQFIDSASLQRAAVEHFTVVEELCRSIDEHVRSVADSLDLVSSRMFFVALKIMYDTVALRVLQLNAVLTAHEPDEVVYFTTVRGAFDHRLLFTDQESIYAQLIPSAAKNLFPQATLTAIESSTRLRSPVSIKLKQIAGLVRHEYRDWIRRRGAGRRYERSICVVETGYGFDEVLPGLADTVDLAFWRPPIYSNVPFGTGVFWSLMGRLRGGSVAATRSFTAAWRAVGASDEFVRRFACQGLSFYSVVRSRLAFLLTDMLPRATLVRDHCERYLHRRRDVRAVLSVNFSFERPWTYVMALAAARSGIPVVTYQHSAFGYFSWPYSKYVDEVMSDYRLVWGRGSVRFMRDVDRTGCEPVIVGSLELERLRDQLSSPTRRSKARPMIVYPVSGYTGNRFYFAKHRLTDTEAFELMKQVLLVLGTATYADVVVKLYPGQADELQRATQEWIERQQWSHVRAVATGAYSSLLAEADVVVIDSPSTVLVQSVLSACRLIVYTGVYEMGASAVDLLRRRADIFDERSAFMEHLKKVIDRREFVTEANSNDDFAAEYCGSHCVDAKGAIVQALVRISNQGRPSANNRERSGA
jgi:hypothetical protein